MIIDLFILLIAISIVMVCIGFYSEVMAVSTVGFFFIFLLSLVLISNSLTHESGIEVQMVNASVTTISYQYSPFSDSTRTYGIYLALGSFAGMVLSLIYNRKRGD